MRKLGVMKYRILLSTLVSSEHNLSVLASLVVMELVNRHSPKEGVSGTLRK